MSQNNIERSYFEYDEDGKVIACGGIKIHNGLESQATVLLKGNEDVRKILSFAEELQKFVNEGNVRQPIITIDDIERQIEDANKSLKDAKREMDETKKQKAEARKMMRLWEKVKIISEVIFGILGFLGGAAFMAFCVLQDFGSIKTVVGLLETFLISGIMGVFFGITLSVLSSILVSKKIRQLNTIIKKSQKRKRELQCEIGGTQKHRESLNRSYMEQLTGIQPPDADAAI